MLDLFRPFARPDTGHGMTKNILLIGESWVTSESHFKGFDSFGSVHFHLGAEPFVAAVSGDDFRVEYMPCHVAVEQLPFTAEGLAAWDAIVISDIGANSLLLHPDVWLRGKPVPNRLKLLRDYCAGGGGLMMVGGYLTFQGIDGKARWHKTAVETALPVTCLPVDDRIEVPEGFRAVIDLPEHPLLQGVGTDWPLLLGANEVVARDGAEVVARLPDDDGGHPLLVAGRHRKGRSLAWTSDIGPHWAPAAFLAWPGYGTLFRNCLGWLTERA
jgi:uncharacterized membrane protein